MFNKLLIVFKKYLFVFFSFIYSIYAIEIGLWNILHGNINFFTDTARDFLILDEISQKGLVLIGPRASGIVGLFHGPLWAYLNYPVYYFSHGNPVAQGWFWAVLIVLFIYTSFIFTLKLTNKNVASIYLILISGYMIQWYPTTYNPVAALMIIPSSIYFLTKYFEKNKNIDFVIYVFIAGLIIQFQMAIGIPLLFVGLLLTYYHLKKNKNYKAVLYLPIILIPLASFWLFELRHSFAQLHAVFNFVLHKTNVEQISLLNRIQQRFTLLVLDGWGIFNSGKMNIFNIIFSFMTILFVFGNSVFKKISKRESIILKISISSYVGFYTFSLIFSRYLVGHYWQPVIPFALMIVAILISKLDFKITIPLLIIIAYMFIYQGNKFVDKSKLAIGKTEDSWVFQKKLAQTIFNDNEKEFGYFIFTPDIYAYESKASMRYFTKINADRDVHVYEKRPITYLIIAPNPSFRADIKSSNWKINKVHLNRKPDKVWNLDDGYIIEKYFLNDKEINVKSEPTLKDWLYFR